jgi:hypothetical protein
MLQSEEGAPLLSARPRAEWVTVWRAAGQGPRSSPPPVLEMKLCCASAVHWPPPPGPPSGLEPTIGPGALHWAWSPPPGLEPATGPGARSAHGQPCAKPDGLGTRHKAPFGTTITFPYGRHSGPVAALAASRYAGRFAQALIIRIAGSYNQCYRSPFLAV